MDIPPSSVQALAANYRCSHCNSDPPQLTQDESGIWHLGIAHDDGCPVLKGTISALPDAARAATSDTFRP